MRINQVQSPSPINKMRLLMGSGERKKSEDETGTELDMETISRSMNSDMREPFRNTATHTQLILL